MIKTRSSTELVELNNFKFSLALPVQSPGPCFLDQSACFPFRSPHSGPTTLRPPAPFVPCHILSPTATMCVCVLECMCVCACLYLSLSRARSLSLSLCEMCLSIRKTVRRECARTASERERASERQREQERDLPEQEEANRLEDDGVHNSTRPQQPRAATEQGMLQASHSLCRNRERDCARL